MPDFGWTSSLRHMSVGSEILIPYRELRGGRVGPTSKRLAKLSERLLPARYSFRTTDEGISVTRVPDAPKGDRNAD